MAPSRERIVPAIGVDLIDLFHSRLGGLLLDARELARVGDTVGVVAKVAEFRETAVGHFSTEEVIMRGVGFEGVQHHRTQHIGYLASIDGGMAELADNDRTASRFELLELIERVLFDHEIVEDGAFFEDLERFKSLPLAWNEGLSVGVSWIDEQHRNHPELPRFLHPAVPSPFQPGAGIPRATRPGWRKASSRARPLGSGSGTTVGRLRNRPALDGGRRLSVLLADRPYRDIG
jgi:hemerythrin